MEKRSESLRASMLTSNDKEQDIVVEADKSMNFIQYLHEVQRKIRALNQRFFKDEEMVESQGIQETIDKVSKQNAESKQIIHHLKISQGNITWKYHLLI